MFDSPMTEIVSSAAVSGNAIARKVGVLIAAMLLTAAVSVALPQQVEAAPGSDVHVTAVQDGVGVLAASGDATDLAFVVTKGQKG